MTAFTVAPIHAENGYVDANPGAIDISAVP